MIYFGLIFLKETEQLPALTPEAAWGVSRQRVGSLAFKASRLQWRSLLQNLESRHWEPLLQFHQTLPVFRRSLSKQKHFPQKISVLTNLCFQEGKFPTKPTFEHPQHNSDPELPSHSLYFIHTPLATLTAEAEATLLCFVYGRIICRGNGTGSAKGDIKQVQERKRNRCSELKE